MSTQFTRVTTTVVLSGAGAEGRGEDVTYTAEDHDWFPELDPPGKTTLGAFSSSLDGLRLFEGEPKMAASAHYRRWALESAALDLALRQNGLSLGDALGREHRPVRFVVSTRGDAFAWLEAAPELELKLDPENEWDRPFMERLAATGRVRVLDLKAYYTGTAVDVDPDPELYRSGRRALSGGRDRGRVARRCLRGHHAPGGAAGSASTRRSIRSRTCADSRSSRDG